MDIVSKDAVISFFNSMAPKWDAMEDNRESVTEAILSEIGDLKGKNVLDVACGTGYMIPYYLKHKALSVTGIDISEGMLEIAKKKYAGNEQVHFNLCDAENFTSQEKYDVCVIYNAFPHFEDKGKVLSNLSKCMNKGGLIAICHGAGRRVIDNCHKNSAAHVSTLLPSDDELKALLNEHFRFENYISNEDMMFFKGKKV